MVDFQELKWIIDIVKPNRAVPPVTEVVVQVKQGHVKMQPLSSTSGISCEKLRKKC